VGGGGTSGMVELSAVEGGLWRLTFQPSSVSHTALSTQSIDYPGRKTRSRQNWLRFPVGGVSYKLVSDYAEWLAKTGRVPGARPCTEWEWERAARGLDGREYPWGNGFNKDAANTWESESTGSGLGGTTAVCTFPQGISPAGVWDMSGNVWEWTRTWYDGERKYRIVRGGSWIGYQWFAHTSFCNWYIPWMFSDNLGFRIVIAPKDTEEKP